MDQEPGHTAAEAGSHAAGAPHADRVLWGRLAHRLRHVVAASQEGSHREGPPKRKVGSGRADGGHSARPEIPGLLTIADATRINMYSKPPPLSIPTIVPPFPSYAIAPKRYNASGSAGYNGPPPGMTSMGYRSFPGPGSTAVGGSGPPGSVTSSPSPPPTMPGRECKFCKNNGETTQMYRSHSLRNPSDGRLICPVLRDHVCEMCGATGDDAHTRNYCPLNAEKKKQAIPLFLKNTRRQSDGHYRI